MSEFFGVIRYEFNMFLRRPGMWIAYLCLYVFYAVLLFMPDPMGEIISFPADETWQVAGQQLFYYNMFMVLLAGIISADRMQRDFRLGVCELQQSTPLRRPVYILAKYFGVLAGSLVPMLILVVGTAVFSILMGAPPQYLGAMLVAFLAMGVPAHAFVVAFSLACPLVMPVRVYQVLFTGYWFWGNYLNPGAFPTISDTVLVPSGKYVLEGFFGGFPSSRNLEWLGPLYTPAGATLNLVVLALCILAVLCVLDRYLKWQARRA